MDNTDPYFLPQEFPDFELIDTGHYQRLERWGSVRIIRPDPQIIWNREASEEEWSNIYAQFVPSSGEEKGKWKIVHEFKRPWAIRYGQTDLKLDLTPFKHTGVFAEQATHWAWMLPKLRTASSPRLKILNLFAYTGAASVILAQAGAFVTHVDASKPSVAWAKENQLLNRVPQDSIRWIVDDAVKFVKRELKRGKRYDGIILDPPAYGHGPSGQVWKFSAHAPGLLRDCADLLSDAASFLVLNAYATNSSALALKNLATQILALKRGTVVAGELCLQDRARRLLSTGIFARWERKS